MPRVLMLIGLVSAFASKGLADENHGFVVEREPDRLVVSHSGKPVAQFVFRDETILRPYFANVHAPGGLLVTRAHPPVAGVDAVDHETMHPGIWLGFGDISGYDYWRNKCRIQHVRFDTEPQQSDESITFATQSLLMTADDKPLCELASSFRLADRPAGWLLVWEATLRSDDADFTFGDQEEMGFGARVATSLAEMNGGRILNSEGATSASHTWGQAANWCDYSGTVDGRQAGITLMAAPENFRPSWWHNRDYGVFVANPFGRAALKQGEPSAILVKRGESFHIVFAAMLHSADDYDPEAAYQDWIKNREVRKPNP